MFRLLATVALLTLPLGPSRAADRILGQPRLADNGDITLGDGLKIGRRDGGGRLTLSPDIVATAGSEFAATNDYGSNGTALMKIFAAAGTRDVPIAGRSAVVVGQKNSAEPSTGQNMTSYFSHWKTTSFPGATSSAVYGESIDIGGGSQSSTLGVVGHAQLNAGALGSAVGVTGGFTLTQGLTSFQHAAGVEVGAENLFADAPAVFNAGNSTSGVLIGNTGTRTSDAAILLNPYPTVPFRNGLYVPASANGANPSGPVSGAVVRSAGTTEYGLDLAPGTQTLASVRVPNGGRITARNGAGTGDIDLLRLDSSNVATAGGAAGVATAGPLLLGAALKPSTSPTAAPTVDMRDSPTVTVPAGGSALIPGVAGMFIIANTSTQNVCQYIGDAGLAFVLIGGNSECAAPTTAPAAGKTSLAFDGVTGTKIYNNTGASASYRVTSFVMR